VTAIADRAYRAQVLRWSADLSTLFFGLSAATSCPGDTCAARIHAWPRRRPGRRRPTRVVSRDAPFNLNAPPMHGSPRYFEGQVPEALTLEDLRMIAWGKAAGGAIQVIEARGLPPPGSLRSPPSS